jgi:adenosine deaminase
MNGDLPTPGARRALPDYSVLPKVELHCHIEGTMRPSTFADLALKNGIPLPVQNPVDLYTYDDLTGFLNVFWLVQSVLVEPEDWERLAYESLLDGAEHGLKYREAFFTPARHLASGQKLSAITSALDRGLAQAEAVTGSSCRLILDFDRAYGPAAALEQIIDLVGLASSPGRDRVIGVGMDSTELGIDPATYVDAYRVAAENGLRRTAHQGENSPATAIATAVDVLGCDRIDHGISIFGDPDLVARFVDHRIPLTVCPNANVRINPDVCATLDDHVFPEMRRVGLLATLNTDDPALTLLDLTLEYAAVAATYGYTWNDMVQISCDGVEASWLDDGEKSRLTTLIKAATEITLSEDQL